MERREPRVGFFVTCLVDLFRPSIGFAAIKLLEDAGCFVSVPGVQTCCGQPAFNSGDRDDAREIAAIAVRAFRGFDYVVAPSGSCAGMIRLQYPELFAGTELESDAETMAERTYDLTSFLTGVLGVDGVAAKFDGTVAYHDSCAGLRELGVKHQPRKLLASVAGLELVELPSAEVCCGFGGTFCVKYPEISVDMARKKARDVVATGAATLAAGDLGCLLNIAGCLSRQGIDVKVRHVAEILAGDTSGPAIGQP